MTVPEAPRLKARVTPALVLWYRRRLSTYTRENRRRYKLALPAAKRMALKKLDADLRLLEPEAAERIRVCLNDACN